MEEPRLGELKHQSTVRAGFFCILALVVGTMVALLAGCGTGDGAPAPAPAPAPTPPTQAPACSPVGTLPAPTDPESMEALVDLQAQLLFLKNLEDFAKRHVSPAAPNGTRSREFPAWSKYVVKYFLARASAVYEAKELPYFDGIWKKTADERLSNSGGKVFNIGTDMWAAAGSGSGTVTAGVAFPSDANRTGCDAEADWAGFETGKIAIVYRENAKCSICDVPVYADKAGAAAVIIVNGKSNNWFDSNPSCASWIKEVPELTVPAFFVKPAAGEILAEPGTVSLRVSGEVIPLGNENVCVDLPGGSADRVLVLGAHLDSVPAGPGINDNGSGSALVLDLIRAFTKRYGVAGDARLQQKLRVCWWGSEEAGLIGSRAYVEQLTQAERDKIIGYINFDSMASRNGINSVGASLEDPINPKASTFIHDALVGAFKDLNQPVKTADDRCKIGCSDFAPFKDAGIPFGNIKAGASAKKTQAEADMFCGTAGEPTDACYHKACDTFENIDQDRQLLFSRVAAQVVQAFLEDETLQEKMKRENLPGPSAASAASSEDERWSEPFVEGAEAAGGSLSVPVLV